MTVLVLLEHDRGMMAEAATEALTAARDLAGKLGDDVEGVLVGDLAGGADDAAAEAGRYGAEVVHHVEHELLADYGPDAWAAGLVSLLEELDVSAEVVAVVATGTDRGNEVMAQIAARLDQPFVANCVAVDSAPDDDPWTITRFQWGGSLLEDVELTAPCRLLTFAHHAIPGEPVTEPFEPDIEPFEPDLDPAVTVTMVHDREVLTEGVTLATAPVVVSGGRGVGSADGFGVLDDLAGLLGGVVGCSRAVTNNGWRPHTDQVGQTGTRIAPDLYIAAGISGAIQHWVGAAASKTILAVNTDPEANMVAKADYAVIADLHQVVPAICDELRRRTGP